MEGEGPILGLCLGSENGTNFANKLGSEFGKWAAKRELANPPPTYLLQDSSQRAAEKIKETNCQCDFNQHELFTRLWSNREGPNR